MDASKETLVHAGDYILESLTLTSQNRGVSADITEFMLELNIYEDIFSFCMSGNLIVADAANLISNFPILGNEYISVKLRTPTLEDSPENVIEKTFQIYAIYDRTLNDDRSQYYNISFMSIEGYENQTAVVTKAFSGSTDEVAQKIYEDYIEYDRSLVIMDTPHTSRIKYTSNHWSPFRNMNFITKTAKGSKLKGSDYLFFESNKAFYFASIEGIIASQQEAVFDEYVLERNGAKMPRRVTDIGYTGNRLPDSVTAIENLKMLTTIDTLEGNNKGAFAASIDGYDLYTKKVINVSSRFNFPDFVKTGSKSIVPSTLLKNPSAHKTFYSHNTGLFNDFGLTDEEDLPSGSTASNISTKLLNRRGYLNSFENNKFEAVLPGRTDIQVGNVISLLYPSAEAPSEDLSTVLDPLLSGFYVVSAIHHQFDTNRHIMTTELIKNGYENSPESAEGSLEGDNENVS